MCVDLTCPFCGLEYRNFRTGLGFADVREMLWVDSDDPKEWRYKRRHTVLGLWHAIKIEMWLSHVHHCREGINETMETHNAIISY